MKIFRAIGSTVHRYQEFLVWLPLLLILSLGAFVVFGALDNRIGPDSLALLMQLPVYAAYLALACGAAWMIKVTYLKDLSCEEEHTLERLVLEGDANARWLLVKDRLEWLVLLGACAAFFWLVR